MPRLEHSRNHFLLGRRLFPLLQVQIHVGPLRPRLFDLGVAVDHVEAATQHGINGIRLGNRVLTVLCLAADVLQQHPGPLPAGGGGGHRLQLGPAQSSTLVGQHHLMHPPHDRRLLLAVQKAHVVMMREHVEAVLPGPEGLAGGDEAQFERLWRGNLPLLEGLLPPGQRVARYRSGAQRRIRIRVKHRAAPVVNQVIELEGQVLRSLPGHKQDGILGHAIRLELQGLIDEFFIAGGRCRDATLLEVVLEEGGDEEALVVGQAPHLAALFHRL